MAASKEVDRLARLGSRREAAGRLDEQLLTEETGRLLLAAVETVAEVLAQAVSLSKYRRVPAILLQY